MDAYRVSDPIQGKEFHNLGGGKSQKPDKNPTVEHKFPFSVHVATLAARCSEKTASVLGKCKEGSVGQGPGDYKQTHIHYHLSQSVMCSYEH